MPKRLVDGEHRVIKSNFKLDEVTVTAIREDSETPYVLLTDPGQPGTEILLTDCGAQSLIERLQLALRLLPSSK